MPSGYYCAEDWGCRMEYTGKPNGAKTIMEFAVNDIGDWTKISLLRPDTGALGRELKCLRAIRAARKDNAPILQTLFCPLTIADKLSGTDLLLKTLRSEPETLMKALEVITITMIDYAAACLEAGAEGFFFATRMSTLEMLSREEHQRFAEPYDIRLIKSTSGKTFFSLFHIHGEEGENIFFREIAPYPVQVINWHDRQNWPALAEGKEIFPGAVMGGVDECGALRQGPPSLICEHVRDAISQTQGRRLMIGAGCGLILDTPEKNLQAFRDAVEEHD